MRSCKSQHRQVLVLKTHQHITCEGIHKSSCLKSLLLLVQRINMQVNILLLRMLQFPAQTSASTQNTPAHYLWGDTQIQLLAQLWTSTSRFESIVTCGFCPSQLRQVLILKTHHHITCEGIYKSICPKSLLLFAHITNMHLQILVNSDKWILPFPA